MDSEFYAKQKQTAADFWKSYFALFRRRVEDHEMSETTPAALTADHAPVPVELLPFPDRRRSRAQRLSALRRR
jgi:hypothetical protein